MAAKESQFGRGLDIDLRARFILYSSCFATTSQEGTMNETLRIGEVAELLGITTKTIRHYEKLELIDPDRTESDYRLYTPDDVLRIQRVRQLQGLGLPLKQIKLILSDAGNEALWEKVLAALLEQIEAEIDMLQDRRQRIAGILDEGVPDAFAQIEAIGIPLQAQRYLDQHLSVAQHSAWQREKQVYAYLNSLPGGDADGRRSAFGALIMGLITGADLYERGMLVAALFAADQPAQPVIAVSPLRWVHETPQFPSEGEDDFRPPRFW
jgi:DNA-binding transcriptional MerR regulator